MQKSSPNILIIGPIPPPHHGVAVYTQALFESPLVEEFNLSHLDTSDRRGLDNFGVFDFVNVSLALQNIAKLLWFCLRGKLDIIYLPLSQNNFGFFRDACFIWIARLFSKAKVVVHFHGSDTFIAFRSQANTFMQWFIPQTLTQIDVMIVLGERLKHIFAKDVKTVEVVYNGTSFAPSVTRKFRRAVSKPTCVSFLGRHCRGKGILDVIHAIPQVLEKHPQVQFLFAGEWRAREPSTQEEASRYIAEHKLERSVKFLGKLLGEEKTNFLIETDIFVLPSSIDAFPLVILEAMAAGCPVISTKNIGAIPEVVIDGKTGILVEKQQPEKIAEAIVRLIENPQLRIAMGKAGWERVEKHFTLEQSMMKLRKVFMSSFCADPQRQHAKEAQLNSYEISTP